MKISSVTANVTSAILVFSARTHFFILVFHFSIGFSALELHEGYRKLKMASYGEFRVRLPLIVTRSYTNSSKNVAYYLLMLL